MMTTMPKMKIPDALAGALRKHHSSTQQNDNNFTVPTKLSGGKREGLLPQQRRVSEMYEGQKEAATTPTTTIRLIACANGLGLIIAGIMIAVLGSGDGGQISVLDVIIVMIDLLVGLFAIFLESNLPSFVQTVRSTITHKVPILGHVTWRGGVYTISGLLNITIIDPLHIVVGLFSTAVGVYMINVGRKAAEHLAKLRASITDENALLKAFMKHDNNGDGYLQQDEFDSLMFSLGMDLDRDELDAIFFQIDVDNDNTIVFDEFRSWFKQATSEVKITDLS